MVTMVKHHTHYKEIHGKDHVVLMDKGEHQRLHRRLRKEGKCGVPVKELRKISSAAGDRLDDHKRYHRKYDKQYFRLLFTNTLMPNVRHYEKIWYNIKTGTAGAYCNFKANSGKKLFYIDLD